MSLTAGRARELLAAFKGKKILVVGDLMLDRYLYGRVERISPEAPVPVVEVLREVDMPGGAGNVAWNVRKLGADTAVAGFLGGDAAGRTLRALLEKEGVDAAAAIAWEGARTAVKTRIIAEQQQVVRVDHEPDGAPPGEAAARLIEVVRAAVPGCAGVIIEDYGKGVARQPLVSAVLEAARRAGIPSGYDPKLGHPLDVSGVTAATPNHREVFGMVNLPEREGDEDEDLERAIQEWQRRWDPELLAVTLGPRGMLLASRDGTRRRLPTRAREVFDVSGAGDTVMAALLLALSGGATQAEAAELANCAAGVVVGKVGTASCSPEELERAVAAGEA